MYEVSTIVEPFFLTERMFSFSVFVVFTNLTFLDCDSLYVACASWSKADPDSVIQQPDLWFPGAPL